jgi:predicted nuclease of predicted toxin-antitoxin system
VRFLVDAQLPPALARRLEAWGHVAEHVADLGMAAVPDHKVREYAAGVGAIIVTKDEDFAVWRLLHDGPAVVWLRLGNTRRLALIARMEAELPAIILALQKGDELVEIS